MNQLPFWIAFLAAVVGGALSTLHISLREASRGRLIELAEERRALHRVQPVLDAIGEHAVAVSLPRVLCNLIVVVAMLLGFTGVGEGSHVAWMDLVWALLVSVPLLYVLGVVIPTSLADHLAERIVLRFSGVIRAAYVLMLPVAGIARVADAIVRRVTGAKEHTPAEEIERELMSVVSEGESEGAIGESERMMIEGVVDLRTTTVQEIMTPRTEIEGIVLTNDLLAIKRFIEKAGHSRIPVYEGDLDHIAGVLYAKDLLQCLGEDPAQFRLRPLLREPHFVPETKPLLALLHELQQQKIHMALVLDEYGGTTGLVTIEDLVEEIVGEIVDEYEPESEAPPRIEVLTEERAVEVDARAYIHDVNHELEGLRLEVPESEEYDTIAGFVTTMLGHMPVTGETFARGGATVKVLEAEPTRVVRVRVEFPPAPEGEGAAPVEEEQQQAAE